MPEHRCVTSAANQAAFLFGVGPGGESAVRGPIQKSPTLYAESKAGIVADSISHSCRRFRENGPLIEQFDDCNNA